MARKKGKGGKNSPLFGSRSTCAAVDHECKRPNTTARNVKYDNKRGHNKDPKPRIRRRRVRKPMSSQSDETLHTVVNTVYKSAMLTGALIAGVGVLVSIVALRSGLLTGSFLLAVCFLLYAYKRGIGPKYVDTV